MNDLPLPFDDEQQEDSQAVKDAQAVFNPETEEKKQTSEIPVKPTVKISKPKIKKTVSKPVATPEPEKVEDTSVEPVASRGLIIKEDEVIEVEKESVKALKMWKNYLNKGWVDKFADIEPYVKLTWLQNIPPQFIKMRPINNSVQCPYIPHEFAEKALNFIFNFNVSSEIIWKDGRNDGKTFECEVEVKFTFNMPDGKQIIKTVFSGHRAYENKAITRADAYKAAVSKAYTVVARQFGIGSNVRDYDPNAKAKSFDEMENNAYDQAINSTEQPAQKAPPQKTFHNADF